ncbi:bifunctional proline dehydrogenase/L-glutamate gamma-semialdehyde dehydrogenase PutA [Cellvibrio mixtus]|uniref:bifunctional proline dehydrogenase/L-glutamate gamma-semialdehyde dehydrogenase PutA n=1 Tax=Cellvibrio mixtus TaxID=39650 RepID=UPI0005879506|nr:bifunctional proline dehydrogenase/L-glutamate gamma-semialdehyde dehydrogenase PutA [Cellvibrio mixtus]
MFSSRCFPRARSLDGWRQAISDHYLVDESAYLAELVHWLDQDEQQIQHINQQTLAFLTRWQRSTAGHNDWPQEFLQAYGLNTREGVVLMCLAESLIRIPDKISARAFIADKLASARWQNRLDEQHPWMINAATWGLVWGERLLEPVDSAGILQNLLRRLGEPVIHTALEKALLWLADTFVFAADINSALERAHAINSKEPELRWHYSFDLLGEAAITHPVAQQYQHNYFSALTQLANSDQKNRYSLSIKLSALHPRYEALQRAQILADLIGTTTSPGILVQLAQQARAGNIPLTIDAEESERLEISLELIEACLRHPALRSWNGFGLAVQAYSKRAIPVLGFIDQLADELKISINVRLVKGAYWDSEIHWAQRAGLSGYPVFTAKATTDISYLACAKFLLHSRHLNPQFATHNATTVCSVIAMAKGKPVEFQRLHGMGESLYRQLLIDHPHIHCRVYSPVGNYSELLPYLVRRLLENGANSSFVNQLNSKDASLESLADHPLHKITESSQRLPLPEELFLHTNVNKSRRNSHGINIQIARQREQLMDAIEPWLDHQWYACPIIGGGYVKAGSVINIINPANNNEQVGICMQARAETAKAAIDQAAEFSSQWRQYPVKDKAILMDKTGDLFEEHRAEFIALLMREAGKTLNDAIDEVREAVDFCHYYAQQALEKLANPLPLPGPTGEHNQLLLEGRGIFVCISPWNFPLAIFTGQIIAALVAGNTVLAKPARQTCLIAFRAIELMLTAGIPPAALYFLPGSSSELSPSLTGDARIEGIAFTGSTQSAWTINRALAARDSSIASLIAETGGQNALIADSTCLPEQLVKDVIRSAFGSAGQRCSALRVLFVQEEIADRVIELLKGAMDCLIIGNPCETRTDIGPVIDKQEQQKLLTHIDNAKIEGRLLAQTHLPAGLEHGNFVAPTLIEIHNINELQEEHFGPICHLIRFRIQDLESVIASINRTGFGLTLGIHTRNETIGQKIAREINVGNVYINRNMIGAVVGVQPFGGCGLSGTGPKAGGPHYLLRFVREKTISNYLAAVGGNIQLLTQKPSAPNTE